MRRGPLRDSCFRGGRERNGSGVVNWRARGISKSAKPSAGKIYMKKKKEGKMKKDGFSYRKEGHRMRCGNSVKARVRKRTQTATRAHEKLSGREVEKWNSGRAHERKTKEPGGTVGRTSEA